MTAVFNRAFILGLCALALVACQTGSDLEADPAAPSSPTLTGPSETASEPDPDIVEEYIGSRFRVLTVKKMPQAPYSFVVATARCRDATPVCSNDTACGSVFVSPECFFFLEPEPDVRAEPETQFVGSWPEDSERSDSLDVDSIRFPNADTVQFKSSGGDGCVGEENTWTLNLRTGEIQRVNHESFNDC